MYADVRTLRCLVIIPQADVLDWTKRAVAKIHAVGLLVIPNYSVMDLGNADVRDKLPPSTSFFVYSRTSKGVGAPHQCPLDSVASYLCHFMLTCGCTFR